MSKYPSIFNDVIGPVMRGPSSSHTAASVRIGRMAMQLFGAIPTEVIIDFDPSGSLATTYDGQGSKMGLLGGFMGFEADDIRLLEVESIAQARGLQLHVRILPYPNHHPNTYRMELRAPDKDVMMITALSTGGGMIEVVELDGCKISCKGGAYEYFFYTDSSGNVPQIIHQTSVRPLRSEEVAQMAVQYGTSKVRITHPVLPILDKNDFAPPFITSAQMIEYAQEHKCNHLWELAVHYEGCRGGIPKTKVFEMMREVVVKIKESVEAGLEGSHYHDRILDCQVLKFREALASGKLLSGSLMNRIIACTISMMEVKSSMGVIVAAPTAGSCAVLPGTVLGTAKELNLSVEEAAKAMLSAGMIGVLIAQHATFAAEVGGCQAECGAGSGMAAAALVELSGGEVQEAVTASSFALQNILGMVCDPVANRVEVPCMGKNVMAAMNALSSANMALAGIDAVIPLDEVIVAMDKVGRMLPYELRCTGYGGLSVTPTAKEIEKKIPLSLYQATVAKPHNNQNITK